MQQKKDLEKRVGSLETAKPLLMNKLYYVFCYGILGWGVMSASGLSLLQEAIGSSVSFVSFLLKLLIFSVLGITLALWNWSRSHDVHP
jgi:hypothetical protein